MICNKMTGIFQLIILEKIFHSYICIAFKTGKAFTQYGQLTINSSRVM